QTLRSMTIEETYELADAITEENWNEIKEELGDILLHILFYTRIATEQNRFTLNDVLETICNKLIVRHPHIYPAKSGEVIKVNDAEDVKKNWEKIKLNEGKSSVLSGVPVSLPAIVKAERIQEKVKQVGFEWKHTEDVWLKVKEELNELHEAVENNNTKEAEEEFGDVLFSLVNYARFLNIDAENALEKTNKKFIHRFSRMEVIAKEQSKNLYDMSLEEMDAIWNIVKKENPIA
ncbi:MAG: nucleoside triphosphate pyrophosphohydrolase, partial [Parafilimonas sp.]